MSFDVSSFKINEIARILEIKPPTVSQRFKDTEEPWVERKNNRITGISPDEVERYLRAKGHEYLYKTSIHIVNSTVGGTSKTSTTAALLGAFRRITAINNLESPGKKNVCMAIDLDSQSSLTSTIIGEPIPDEDKIILDYFEGRTSLEQIIRKVNEQEVYCIGSNLNNIYLDKFFSRPKLIRDSMKRLLNEIIAKFGENCRIVIDTPPQLSLAMNSAVCALAQFMEEKKDYTLGIVIPIRTDDYALKGARITHDESREITSTFNLPEVPIHCFISAYDKRLKIGTEIMKRLFQDEMLSKTINPIMIRNCSEISKANMKKESIFAKGTNNNATMDYQDLALSLLGYREKEGIQ